MRKIHICGVAALLLIASAGCSDSSPTLLTPDAAPSYDGGYLGGSGNRGDTTTVPMSTTAGGGYLGGSGN